MAIVTDAWTTWSDKRDELANLSPKTKRTPVLIKIAEVAARRLPKWRNLRSGVLQLGGLGSATYAAFQQDPRLGWIAVSVSAFVFEYLVNSDGT